MGRLRVSFQPDGSTVWIDLQSVEQGTSGSLSNHRDGKREIYGFTAGAQASTVWRSPGGIDWEVGRGRGIVMAAGQQTVATLDASNLEYSMHVVTDRGTAGTIRWRHEQNERRGST